MKNQVPLVHEIPEGVTLYRGTPNEFNYKNKNVLYLAPNKNITNQYGTTRVFEVVEPLRLIYMNDPLTVMYMKEKATRDGKHISALRRSFPLSMDGTMVARHSKVEDDIKVAELACKLGFDGYYGDRFDGVSGNNLNKFNIPDEVTGMLKKSELVSFHSEIALCKKAVGKIIKISKTEMSNQPPNSASPMGPASRINYISGSESEDEDGPPRGRFETGGRRLKF